MGKHISVNLANLEREFGAAAGELQSRLAEIANDYANELRDIGGLKIMCEPLDCYTKVVLVAVLSVKDKEHAFTQRITSPEINYAPIIRGWVEGILESSAG